MIVVKQLIVRL